MMKSSRFLRQILCLLLIICGFVMSISSCSRERIKNEDTTVGNQESVVDTYETETDHVPDETDTDVEIGTVTDTEKETKIESQIETTKDPNQGEWDPQS